MARLRVRNNENSRWIDICQSDWYMRNNSNTGWISIEPSRGVKARHGTNNYWLNIDCLTEYDCDDDPYGGTEDGKGTNGRGPGLINPDSDYPGEEGPDGEDSFFDPYIPIVLGPEDPGYVPPTTTTVVFVDDGSGGVTPVIVNGPSTPGYNDPTAGSGSNPINPGDFTGEYPPGYGLPDSNGPDAGPVVIDGETCINRPGLGICESYDDSNGDGSDGNDGTLDNPNECPVTINGNGQIITEFYTQIGNVSGQVDFAYFIRDGAASVDIYYAGLIQATTGGQVSGVGSLPIQFVFNGSDTTVFVRVRMVAETIWTVTAPCPGEQEEIGTILHPAPCSGTFEPTHGGGSGVQEIVHEMGTEAGEVTIEYQMWNLPDKFDVVYRGQVLASTNGPVSGTGQFKFMYTPVGDDTFLFLRIESFDADTSWVYLISCPGALGTPDDPLPCDPEFVSVSGGAGQTDLFYDLGTEPGDVAVRYNMWAIPDKMEILQGGTLLATTGYVSGDDYIHFQYNPAGGNIQVRMTGDNRNTAWAFIMDCPYDPPVVTITPASVDVIEGSVGLTQQCFDLTIDREATREILIDYRTQDGTAVSVAGDSYILAEDSNGNPFIGAFESPNGGRVVYDGGFPKFYDSSWTRTTSYASMQSQGKFIVNVLNWIKDIAKVAAGINDVLILGDANAGESYNVKETFVNIFTDCAVAAGLNPVFRTRSDYGDMPMAISTAEIDSYCAIVVMSSYTGSLSTQRLTPDTANYISSFVSSGSGLCLITDHDVFQTLGNELAVKFNATFSGVVNRVPVSVDTLVATLGAHPLWENMAGETLSAGGSEGNIAVGTFNFDFVSVAGTAIIPIGATGTQICIDINADTETELDESFTLVLDNPINATLGTGSVTVNILDDDQLISIACGTQFDGTGGEIVEATITGAANAYSLVNYSTELTAIAPATGAGNTVSVSYTGVAQYDSPAGLLRYANVSPGAVVVPTIVGQDIITISASSQTPWNTRVECAIPYNTSFGFTNFNQGKPNATELAVHAGVGADVMTISHIASSLGGGATLTAYMTMIHTPTGSMTIRGTVDDYADVFLVGASGTGLIPTSVATFHIANGVTSTNTVVPAGTYFVYVFVENVPKTGDNPTTLSLQIAETGTGQVLSVTNSDWKYAIFETGQPNVVGIPTTTALIFDLDAEANLYITNNSAPTIADIFATWGRTDGITYFADAASSTGEAATWYFASGPDRFVMPTNTIRPNQILSPTALDNFDFAATLSSTDGDDDAIGLTIAHVREGGVDYSLVVVRTQGGVVPISGYGLVYVAGSGVRLITDHGATSNPVAGTWTGHQSRIEVTRDNDIFYYRASNWDALTTFGPTFQINLNSDPDLLKFRGSSSFGFYTYSQGESTYLDVVQPAAIDSKIYSEESDSVWDSATGAWVLQGSGLAFSDHLGGGLYYATNPQTGKNYHINYKSQRKA